MKNERLQTIGIIIGIIIIFAILVLSFDRFEKIDSGEMVWVSESEMYR